MSDRDDKLWAAILKALPIDCTTEVRVNRDEILLRDPDSLADAILAAVNAVLEEQEKVTWGVRCIKGVHCLHFSPGPHIFGSRETAEAYVGKAGLGVHELAQLRSWRGEWEAVP